jgi:hypothetical protein
MGMRGCHPNDVWAEVREWLARHEVPVPVSLPEYLMSEGHSLPANR